MSFGKIPLDTNPLSDGNRIIQGLWIGPRLSTMEQLSIASFLQNGHQYYLYAYNDIPNIPSGTVLKDAAEILPGAAIFKYKDRDSYAGFSNFFRYKLLLERGGWWVDTDVVCLRPFDFPAEYVFASETIVGRPTSAASCVIKVPIRSEVMAYAFRVCQSKKPERLVWGETGPRLVTALIQNYQLDKYQKPDYIFCPIPYSNWHQVLQPHLAAIHGRAYAIHLWNEMWRLNAQDKDTSYHPACLYERLKSRYL